MLKNILQVKGAKALSRSEQKNVNGGVSMSRGCNPAEECCYVCTCGLNNYFVYPGQSCALSTCNLSRVCA